MFAHALQIMSNSDDLSWTGSQDIEGKEHCKGDLAGSFPLQWVDRAKSAVVSMLPPALVLSLTAAFECYLKAIFEAEQNARSQDEASMFGPCSWQMGKKVELGATWLHGIKGHPVSTIWLCSTA